MTPLTVTPGAATSEPVMRPAANLTVGDRIAAGFLPERDAAEVGFVHHHLLSGEPWVFVAYHFTSGAVPASSYFRADALIPLEGVADFTGLTFSREADDPTPVSPARVPPHTGGIEGVAKPTTVRADDGGVLVTDGTCD